MKDILVATDLSESSDAVVARALEMAEPFGAGITVMHVLTESKV